MIKSDLIEAALTLYRKGMGIRQISLALSISRNTVRNSFGSYVASVSLPASKKRN